jgi:hypothetical protein
VPALETGEQIVVSVFFLTSGRMIADASREG